MKERLLIILLMLVAVISCNYDKENANSMKKNKLVGTWRLVEYSDFDTVNNRWTHPYGDHPKGYFTIQAVASLT